ncbi:MAG: hypothetical protein AB7O79_14890 [Xanthobacteraceae bacterium]
MIARGISALWRGEVSLATIFWEYAIAWGTLINLLCSGGALIAFMNRVHDWIGLGLHFAPTPLNALLVVSTWRAAAREQSALSTFARPAILVWFVLMLVL